MNIIKIIAQYLHDHFKEFALDFIIALAFFGIGWAIIGHYGIMGFNLKWFIFFELPLYLFCCWAIYSSYKIYKMAKTLNKE